VSIQHSEIVPKTVLINYAETTQSSEQEVDVGWYGGDHGTSAYHLIVLKCFSD
jgi:hypothetical protein